MLEATGTWCGLVARAAPGGVGVVEAAVPAVTAVTVADEGPEDVVCDGSWAAAEVAADEAVAGTSTAPFAS